MWTTTISHRGCFSLKKMQYCSYFTLTKSESHQSIYSHTATPMKELDQIMFERKTFQISIWLTTSCKVLWPGFEHVIWCDLVWCHRSCIFVDITRNLMWFSVMSTKMHDLCCKSLSTTLVWCWTTTTWTILLSQSKLSSWICTYT